MSVKNLSDSIRDLEKQPTVGLPNQKDADILMPSTKGVYYIMFTRYPDPDVVNVDALRQIFRMLQKSITVPDIAYNTVDSVNGFAGTSKSYAPGSVEYDNTFTVGLNENVDRIVLREMFNWTNSIMDHTTGLSRFENYTSRNISADIMVIHTKPVLITTPESLAENMQQVWFFKQCIPTNMPLSAYGSATKDESAKVELEINFKFRDFVTSLTNPQLKDYALKQLPKLIEGVQISDDVKFDQ